jgi:hypothetical protein
VLIAGETLHALSKRHGTSRQLIRIWVAKFEADALGYEFGGFHHRHAALWRLTPSYQFDLRAMAAGRGQAGVARERRSVRRFGQRDIGSIIGGQIIPQFPDARQEGVVRDRSATKDFKRGRSVDDDPPRSRSVPTALAGGTGGAVSVRLCKRARNSSIVGRSAT